jgi:hypothetical protein
VDGVHAVGGDHAVGVRVLDWSSEVVEQGVVITIKRKHNVIKPNVKPRR